MVLPPWWPIAAAPVLILGVLAAGQTGPYTKDQAVAGGKAYAASCARCHGAKLDGGMGPPLKGALAPFHGTETVGDVYRYVSTQMPLDAPGSLRPSVYAAIVAFLVMQNGHAPGARPLTPATAVHSTLKI
jgi:mono/diheme cytochrome c family protein